ncbi:RnfH family protein [Paucibacter soli]|uniref:RnfH family protein n=1 Tax=Paucibacter soli TaxID=3133433 RepID=UPI0030A800D7
MGHADDGFTVELVWSPARGEVCHRLLRLAAGSTVAQALSACPDFPGLAPGQKVGVWGRLQGLDTLLRPRDRIEIYRPLTVDPKEARRERYRAKGERIVSRHRPLAGKTSR